MSAPHHDTLLNDLLLGEAGDEALARAERAAADDPALRAEADGLAALAATLRSLPREAWDPPTPPPLALPVDAAPAPAREPWWRRSMIRPLAIGVAAEALLAAGVGIGRVSSGGDGPSGAEVRLAALDREMPGATGDAVLDRADGTLRLAVGGLRPSAAGDHYEVWLIRDGTTRMVALGGFRVPESGRAVVQVPVPVDTDTFDVIDVSVEPSDGRPAHSGRSVLRAKA
jgi:hypothetical protein